MSLLFVAGMPIGDSLKNIAPETFEKMKSCDFLIGEERKTVLNLLAFLDRRGEEFGLLNEHSTDIDRKELVEKVKKASSTVFFSDCGTPSISDPDFKFISMCREAGVEIVSLAGASSITGAISVSGIDCKSFFFAGFPPKESKARKLFFKNCEKNEHPVVFMERPYYIEQTLEELLFLNRRIFISVAIGFKEEKNLYDYPNILLEKLKGVKAPFVVITPPPKKIAKLKK